MNHETDVFVSYFSFKLILETTCTYVHSSSNFNNSRSIHSLRHGVYG